MITTVLFLNVLTATPIALPGGPPVGMDYLAFDPVNHRVWVPAGNTGNVDVIDAATGKVTAVGGFPTAPSQRPGRPNSGPSSATIGDGVVWIGNRADKKLCAVDSKTLEKKNCVELTSSPDGLQYVPSTHELWVTTPRDGSLTIIDTTGKAAPAIIKVDGPEGYALDSVHGLYFTNQEDKDKTLAIDIKTRKIVSTWEPGCGKEGPRGLAIDVARRLLFVACTDGAATLDLAHDGKVLGRIKTGAGVDNIDYSVDRKSLYIASGKDSTLTIAKVADNGALSVAATATTSEGARNAVVDSTGAAYCADSRNGRILVVKP